MPQPLWVETQTRSASDSTSGSADPPANRAHSPQASGIRIPETRARDTSEWVKRNQCGNAPPLPATHTPDLRCSVLLEDFNEKSGEITLESRWEGFGRRSGRLDQIICTITSKQGLSFLPKLLSLLFLLCHGIEWRGTSWLINPPSTAECDSSDPTSHCPLCMFYRHMPFCCITLYVRSLCLTPTIGYRVRFKDFPLGRLLPQCRAYAEDRGPSFQKDTEP